jgi:predicted ester cyclase
MSEAREIVDRMIRSWNDHDPAWMDNFSDDAELSAPGIEGSGSEPIRTIYSLWQDAFADVHVRPVAIYVDGDSFSLRAVIEGTHTGTFNAPGLAPIEATNRKISVPFANIATVRNGKVNSLAIYIDRAEVMAQLGVGG